MPDYSLTYWPIPFRGHFIRFPLAAAGASWDETGFDTTAAAKSAPLADQPVPFMAPPLLLDHSTGTALSQMPAIVMYLGRRHGLSTDPDLELRLLCDASDILFEITRTHGAQMWDRPSWAEFRTDRLPRWMQIHEALIDAPAAGFVSGDAPMLADLTLAALWHTMIDRLPPLRADLTAHAPRLTALVDRVAATPAIAALLATWATRDPVYCAGQIEASLLDMLERDKS